MKEQIYTNKKDLLGFMAVVIGILGIFSSPTIFIGFLLGIAAITLGALSRIHYEKFNSKNVFGISLGIISLFFSIVFLFTYKVLLQDPAFMAEYERAMKEMMEMYYAK